MTAFLMNQTSAQKDTNCVITEIILMILER